jgi:acyl-CoA thioester hydrolase
MAFVWPVRVYWEDTDAGGVVYYANYLKFLERARSEWLRARGFEQDALRDDAGVVFVVRRVEIDYLAPARFNDQLTVSVTLAELGRASLEVEQSIACGPTRLASARVRLACVDAARFKPAKIPSPILQALADAT